ncbi:MAG: response regulator [Candidatus Eiseniibacteriota bacterium]
MKPGGPRILVVDDDPDMKDALAGMIQSEGWSFYEASTVEEALAAVSDVEPDVIVLEPRTEGGNCESLLVTLRRDNEWIPVLLHTSEPAVDEQYALEHGASGLERKPEGMEGLKTRIAKLLDSQQTDRPL